MTDIVAAIVKSFRKLTPLYIAVSVAAGATLFMPANLAKRIGIDQLDSGSRAWIGVAFLGALSCLLALAMTVLHDWMQGQRARLRSKRRQRDSLENLTSTEKAYLIPFVAGQRNTVQFRVSDGVVGGLEAKRILYRSSNIGEYLEFPYNLQPCTRVALEASLTLLDGYSEQEFASRIRPENATGVMRELADMGIRSDRVILLDRSSVARQRAIENSSE